MTTRDHIVQLIKQYKQNKHAKTKYYPIKLHEHILFYNIVHRTNIQTSDIEKLMALL